MNLKKQVFEINHNDVLVLANGTTVKLSGIRGRSARLNIKANSNVRIIRSEINNHPKGSLSKTFDHFLLPC